MATSRLSTGESYPYAVDQAATEQVAVRTVLRNRVYLGEVSFRDTWYPGQHQPLVDQASFDAVQQLMAERGEAHSKRASNASDYLLVSRVRCLRCGKQFVGAWSTRRRSTTSPTPASRW
jgi:site-specific DNA recombinase